MEKYMEVLKSCPLFRSLRETSIREVLHCFEVRILRVKKNNTVFRDGSAAGWVGVVLSGAVQAVREDYLGNRSILSMAAPGDLVGEGFACGGMEVLPVSIVAVQDSEILIMDCSHVLTICPRACAHHNQIVRNLLQSMAESNLRLNQKIEILSKRTTREKIMAYLLSEAAIAGRAEFDIPYDRQELADFLGVERSAMSTVIGKLRDEGLIEVSRRHFKLLQINPGGKTQKA